MNLKAAIVKLPSLLPLVAGMQVENWALSIPGWINFKESFLGRDYSVIVG